MIEHVFFNAPESGLPPVERLAAGEPMPSLVKPDAPTGMMMYPPCGIIAFPVFPNLKPLERRIWAGGRWQLGILPAGNHNTVLHVGFKLEGVRELSVDHCYSAELHRRRSGGHDVRDMMVEGLMINAILVDWNTRLVAALRQTRLSARMAAALHGEFSRQHAYRDGYLPGLELLGAQATLAANPNLTRERCLAWEHSMADV